MDICLSYIDYVQNTIKKDEIEIEKIYNKLLYISGYNFCDGIKLWESYIAFLKKNKKNTAKLAKVYNNLVSIPLENNETVMEECKKANKKNVNHYLNLE